MSFMLNNDTSMHLFIAWLAHQKSGKNKILLWVFSQNTTINRQTLEFYIQNNAEN